MENSCYSCGRKGHFSRECPDFEETCFSCGKPGHHQRECEKSSRKITCYNCGKTGHVLKHCLIPETKDFKCSSCKDSGSAKRKYPDSDAFMSSRSSDNEEMESSCYRCGRSGHFARECGDAKSCYSCGKPGHVSKDCGMNDDKITCYKCGKSGHVSRDCEMSDGKINCYVCGKFGHKSFNCPDYGYSSDSSLCYRCNEPGHISRNCRSSGSDKYRRSSRSDSKPRNIGIEAWERDFAANKAEADALLKTWSMQLS